MKITSTSIPEVLLIEPRIFEDERGAFFEAYNQREFARAGIAEQFLQDNQSISKKGVLRGLHYQIRQPQGKLVRVIRGEIFDVAVDCRRSSPYFGQFVAMKLSKDNRKALWIPKGFAHGFLVLSDVAEVLYKATDFYAPEFERTLIWNDPRLAIPWQIQQPIVSAKDRNGSLFDEAEMYD